MRYSCENAGKDESYSLFGQKKTQHKQILNDERKTKKIFFFKQTKLKSFSIKSYDLMPLIDRTNKKKKRMDTSSYMDKMLRSRIQTPHTLVK